MGNLRAIFVLLLGVLLTCPPQWCGNSFGTHTIPFAPHHKTLSLSRCSTVACAQLDGRLSPTKVRAQSDTMTPPLAEVSCDRLPQQALT